MPYEFDEVIDTLRMIEVEHFDIRTVTLGISLRDCAGCGITELKQKVRSKILKTASKHLEIAKEVESMYGVRIANKRLSVTPLSVPFDHFRESEFIELGLLLDNCAMELGVDFVGGYSALVQKGMTAGEKALIQSVPDMMAATERVCSSINVATTKAGINMDAVRLLGFIIKDIAAKTPQGSGGARFVAFCNAPEDNPFVAGAFHGVGEPDVTINVGVSGPGVILASIKEAGNCDLETLCETIKKTAFKITCAGELIGRKVAKRLGVPFGIVDISLAPKPVWGDSIAEIIEAMGIESAGAPGSTAALMLLNDSVKKGGMMASSSVGGMSGAFIPVSEDLGMVRAVERGSLSLEKLEAMTSVCSVGLDMVAVPGDTPAETISAILADECAIGIINNKTTALRIIVPPGTEVGDIVELGGLLGKAIVMPVSRFSSAGFINRGGRIPPPTRGVNN